MQSSRLTTRRKFSLPIAVFGILLVAVIGSTYVIFSHAASIPTAFEAESGTTTAGATKVSDDAASGSEAVKFGSGDTPDNTTYADSNAPWTLKAGESVDDNLPAGVQIINYDSYSNNGARSVGQTLAAIRSAATGPYFVRMPAGTFHITDFGFAAGSGTGKGYQDVNSTKYFGGLIGAGADKTFVVVDPNIMTSAQLSGVSSATDPVQMYAIYAGSPGLTIPTFFSGITFRGNFQQTITLNGLGGTAPAPYIGLSLTSVKAGSMVQYCRFQGFGFDAKASPPYELGSIQSGHSSWTLRRTEIDGRLAKEVNPVQPVSSGGLMWNYEVNVKVVDSWLHNTRRSGWAMHDHAPTEGGNANDPGVYYASNFQVEHIADTPDDFAGSALGFNTSNIEEMRQTFTYIRPRFTVATGVHIGLATSNSNTISKGITVEDPVIGNTAYNGCLVIGITKQPNSLGLSPYYLLFQSGGLSALPITVTKNGVKLQPVQEINFNAAVDTPDKYYVVRI